MVFPPVVLVGLPVKVAQGFQLFGAPGHIAFVDKQMVGNAVLGGAGVVLQMEQNQVHGAGKAQLPQAFRHEALAAAA